MCQQWRCHRLRMPSDLCVFVCQCACWHRGPESKCVELLVFSSHWQVTLLVLVVEAMASVLSATAFQMPMATSFTSHPNTPLLSPSNKHPPFIPPHHLFFLLLFFIFFFDRPISAITIDCFDCFVSLLSAEQQQPLLHQFW